MKIFSQTISILLFLAACAVATLAYLNALDYESRARQISTGLDIWEQTETAGKKLLEDLSFGLYDGYSEQLIFLNDLQKQQQRSAELTQQYTLVYFAIIAVLLFWVAVMHNPRDALAQALLASSLPSLIVGLLAPILMIVAYKDVPGLGEVVFQFQSKGIITSIQTLLHSATPAIGMLLLIFSVIIPFVKTLMLLTAGSVRLRHVAIKGLRWAHHLGRWSMADVFVVALLLSYFITDDNDFTHAEIQSGFWFFLGYVLLSMSGALLLDNNSKHKAV